MTDKQDQPKLKHELGLLDGTMLVAGSMIGSGIFIVSADIVHAKCRLRRLADSRMADHRLYDAYRCRKLWRAERHVP